MYKTLKTVAVALTLTIFASCTPDDILNAAQALERRNVECVAFPLPEEHVFGDATAAIQSWRAETCRRGWSVNDTEKWIPFVVDVVIGESGGCWNIRRGAKMADPVGCVLTKQGKYSDSGYGQLISIHYRMNSRNSAQGWLCVQDGLCSSDDIIATPESSMTALVALIERSGNSGWCYNAKARRQHNCRLSP